MTLRLFPDLYLLAKRGEVHPPLAYPLDMTKADRIGHVR